MYDAGSAGIKIKPNFEGFIKKVEAELKSMNFSVDVTMGIDTTAARTEVEEFRRFASENVSFRMSAETTRAAEEVAALRREASRNASMRVDAETAAADAEVAALRAQASRNASMRVDADTAAAHAQVAALQAAASASPTMTPNFNGSGARSGATRLASSLRSVLTLQASVIGVVGAPGVVADLLAIVGAAAKATHALALIPSVGFAGLAGLGSVATGFSGISGAFKAFSKQTDSSGSDAGESIDKADAVSNAQYGVAAADRAATSANKDLTDSYKDASRSLRDLNNELQDQKLSTEDASLGVEEAARRLAEVQRDPSSDSVARRRADLSYREAKQRLKEQKEQTSDLQQDTAEANAKGKDGSDQVTAAKQKQVEAVHAQIEAEQALAKAGRSQSAGSSAESAVDKAMAKLSPKAKEMVTDIRELGPAWTDARKAAQDALTDGMGPAVTKLAQTQLPGLKDGMVAINGAINTGLRESISALSTDTAKADFKTSLTNTALGFENAAKGARPLTDAVTKLITVGSEFLPRMGTAFTNGATNFNNRIQAAAATGALTRWIQDGIDAAKTFLGLLHDVGSITASVFRAADADGFTKSLRDTTQEWAAFAKSGVGQNKMASYFDGARDRLATLQPLLAQLPSLVSSVADGFHAWSAIITPVLTTIASLMGSQPGLLSTAVVGWLAFKTVSPIFTGIRGQITQTDSALNRMRGVATTAGTAIGSFGTAVRGIVGAAITPTGTANIAGMTAGLGRFGSAVQQLGTHVPVIGRMQTAFFSAAGSAATFGRTAGTTAAAAEGLRSTVRGLSSAGSSLVSALGGPWIVGLAAAALAVYSFWSEMKRGEEHTKALQQALRDVAVARNDLTSIFAEGGGAFNTEAIGNVTTQIGIMKKSIEDAGNNTAGFWEKGSSLLDFSLSSDSAQDKDWYADRWKGAKKVIDDLKISDKELAETLGDTSKFNDLSTKLQGLGTDGKFALSELTGLKDGIDKARTLALDTTPGFTSLTTSVKTLADTSASGADRLSALKSALDVLAGKTLSAEDAMSRYNEQVRATTQLKQEWDASKGTGDALLDGDKVDTTTLNGKKLRDALLAIRDATADAAIAGNDLGPILDKNQGQFETLAQATGLDVTVIESLATGIGYLPGEIKILASLQGADSVQQQLSVINAELETHKDGITIPTKALTDETKAKLQGLVDIKEVVGKPDEIKLVARNADALTALQEVIDKLKDVDNQKIADKNVKIKWDLPTDAATVAADRAARAASPQPGGRATGGQLPTTGPGTETRDGILAVNGAGTPVARVDGGEWVVNRQSSMKYGTELAQINAGTFRQLPGHEEGGVVGDEEKTDADTIKAKDATKADTSKAQDATKAVSRVPTLVSYAQSIAGTPYGGAFDCSGTQSKLANTAVGREPDAGRMATSNEGEFLSALGFKTGVGNSSTFRIGWINDANMAAGGHTAGTLPNGVNVESGGATSTVMYGGQAIGAGDTMFNQRAYLVMNSAGGSGAYTPGASPGTSLVTNPQAALPGKATDSALTISEDKAAVDTANSERNATYANPASTDADKLAADRKYQKAQNTLESAQKTSDTSALSLKGIFSKAGGYLADAVLSGLGLENSIFSENNTYNKAATSLYDHFNTGGTSIGGYSYTPQNLPTIVTTETPQSDVVVNDPSLATAVPSAGGTAGTDHTAGVERWRSTFASILSALGKPTSWLEPGLVQMQTESGGDANAINENDTDGKGGTQTVKGLMQMLDATYASYRSAQYGGGIYNGASNIAASINYTSARYGDALGVWGQGHGYADGGRIAGTGGGRSDGIPIWASADEFMVNAYESQRNGDALEAINAGRWSPVSIDPSQMIRNTSTNNTGAQYITNITEPRVADVQDLADLVERRAHVASMGQLAAVG